MQKFIEIKKHIKRNILTLFSIISMIRSIFLQLQSFFFARSKRTLMVFTDSRGYEITKPWNKQNPCSNSYIKALAKCFRIRLRICPYQHTTLLDFIYEYYKSEKKFDSYVCHVGIVDFSPRPRAEAAKILVEKMKKLEKVGLSLQGLSIEKIDELYNGDELGRIYCLDSFRKYIIPILKSVPNIIVIGANPILPNWRGSYWRDRPKSMNSVLKFYELLAESGVPVLSLSEFQCEEIKKYTSDNIHPNPSGFDLILSKLCSFYKELDFERT